MRVDHVIYAAEHDGAQATAARIAKQLGVGAIDGGVHPRFGTRNVILPLLADRYIEVVEVLDHPASDKAPFGQVVRARSEAGGGWLGWVVGVDDITTQERRLGRDAVEGNRHRPDGVELRWKQLGIKGLQSDPQLPFFIEWDTEVPHPSSAGQTDVALTSLEIAGDPERVRDWIGIEHGPRALSDEVGFDFVAPRGTPGLLSASFTTPTGAVTL